ncbi:MAG: flagellar biosynthesis protein FlhB [Candidatus Marinamargulisbacteria bacterium]|nr:flagellar biosynthesis protein FlhB [Candidatus Marinamargulisbacteria bacterium]
MGDDSSEKTEEPTPHKLREARKKGQIAKGKDLTGAVGMLAVFFILQGVSLQMWSQIMELTQTLFSTIGQPFSLDLAYTSMATLMWSFLQLMTPLFAGIIVVILVLEILQTQALIYWGAILPDIKKLDPIAGTKKFFSLKQYVETLKSIAKILMISFLIYNVVKSYLPYFFISGQMPAMQVMILVGMLVMRMVIQIGIFYLIIAILDYMYQQYEYTKSLRMSKKEIQNEYKQLEGDPMIKQRQRDQQRQLAQSRQMGAVPGADVVVTNPTHIAIAIRYDSETMQSPMIVARGRQLLAQAIRQVADSHYIPIIQNPLLARKLYKQSVAGQFVPPEYYQAVAEILAFVYNLKRKRRQRLAPQE